MLALLFAVMLGAQNVTADDVQRMQDTVNSVSNDINQLRRTDSALAGQLERQLEEVRDEIGYLRVRIRRNEPVDRDEYRRASDRLEDIRIRAGGESTRQAPAFDSTRSPSLSEVAVGTEFDVRLQTSLSSKTAQVEDRFSATTLADIRSGDNVLVPAGSVLRGTVNAVDRATRVDRKGSLTLTFDRITIDGRTYDLRATVVSSTESEGIKGETGKIGVGRPPAASSARSSAAPRARCRASSSAAVGLWPPRKEKTSNCPRARSFASAWTRRSI